MGDSVSTAHCLERSWSPAGDVASIGGYIDKS